jgi:hypothetical protein
MKKGFFRGCSYPEASPPLPPSPGRCGKVVAPFTLVSARAIGVDEVQCSERYSTLLHCGQWSFLLRRVEERHGRTIHQDTWQTVLRSTDLSEANRFSSSPRVTLPNTLNMSHNAAFSCVDGAVVAWGGRRKIAYPRKPYNEPGIFRAEGRIDSRGGLVWGPPRLVLDGAIGSGCVDRRRTVGRLCEFDGKVSVAQHGGRTYLFARANLGEFCGGRSAQVTSSPDGVSGWSRWSLLRFADEALDRAEQTGDGVYFIAVRSQAGRLVGYMPGLIRGVGGIYRSESSDGIQWSKPKLLIQSAVQPEGRTADYPVDGSFSAVGSSETVGSSSAWSSGRSQLDVEHAVQLDHGDDLKSCAARPYICRWSDRNREAIA